MYTHPNPSLPNQLDPPSHLRPPHLPHAQLPSSDSSPNSNFNSNSSPNANPNSNPSSHNALTTQRGDNSTHSSSSERFHEPITSRECESNSDPDSSNGNTARRINRMGGLGRAVEEMFVNGPARRAGEAQVEMAGVGCSVYYPPL